MLADPMNQPRETRMRAFGCNLAAVAHPHGTGADQNEGRNEQCR